MSNTNTSQLLLALDEQRKNLAANLSQKGVAASNTEGLSALVPKVLDISGGSSGGGGSDNLDVQHIISTRTTVSGQYAVFSDWKTIIPDLDKVVAVLIYYNSNAVFCLKENFENRSSISGGVFVPGAMFSLNNDTFQTWDITEYRTGLRFYDDSFGIQMTMNGSNLSAATKEAMFIVQERS